MKLSRRDLVKGTLATPLVLTARTAQAWAVTSVGVCRANDKDRASSSPPPQMCNTMSDDWLRCQVQVCSLYDNKGKQISGKYCKACGTGSGWQTSSCYWQLDDSNPNNIKIIQTSWTTSNCTSKSTTECKYGLVYCDDSGQICGYGCQSNGGYPVSTSCWTSLVPGKTTSLTM